MLSMPFLMSAPPNARLAATLPHLNASGAGLANFDQKNEFGGPAPDAFKWGNVAANLALGGALIKKGMDNM